MPPLAVNVSAVFCTSIPCCGDGIILYNTSVVDANTVPPFGIAANVDGPAKSGSCDGSYV